MKTQMRLQLDKKQLIFIACPANMYSSVIHSGGHKTSINFANTTPRCSLTMSDRRLGILKSAQATRTDGMPDKRSDNINNSVSNS